MQGFPPMADRPNRADVRSPVAFDVFRRRAASPPRWSQRARGRGRRAARAHRPRHGRRRHRGTAQPRGDASDSSRPSSSRSVHARARGPAHPRLRARPHRPRRCSPRSRTSAPTASAASSRWPTTCASSASRSTDTASQHDVARPPAPRRRAARRPTRASTLTKNEVFARYLVPGTPTYVGALAAHGQAGDRRHPRRRRPRRLGAPVLGRRAGRAARCASSPPTGIDGVEAFYVTHTEEQTRAPTRARARARPDHDRLGRLPRAGARRTSIAFAPSTCTAWNPTSAASRAADLIFGALECVAWCASASSVRCRSSATGPRSRSPAAGCKRCWRGSRWRAGARSAPAPWSTRCGTTSCRPISSTRCSR